MIRLPGKTLCPTSRILTKFSSRFTIFAIILKYYPFRLPLSIEANYTKKKCVLPYALTNLLLYFL